MANELIVTNAAALAALVDKSTGDTLTAAEYTTLKDSVQEANTATRTANTVFSGPTTGSAAAPAFRALVADDMAALRTFVRPLSAATNVGGGFYQSSLFRFTLANPDAFAAQLILAVKITDASVKTGSMYVESLLHGGRDGSTMISAIPAGLLRSNYAGTGGTSIGFSQLAASASSPNVDFTFLISPTGFSSPTVSMSAIVICPGDVAVSIL